MAIDLGDLYRLTFTLTSPAGGAVNADTVSLTITLPDGTTTTPAVTNPPSATGQYVVDYQTVQAGRHSVRWLATGTNFGAHTDAFDVISATPDYIISLADAKAHLNMSAIPLPSDEQLREFVEAATLVIERHLDQCVVRRTVTEEKYLPDYIYGQGQGYYPGQTTVLTPRRISLTKTPTQSLVSVARVDGTYSWDITKMHLSTSGIIDTLFNTPLFGHITITYVAGMALIPANYTVAAKIIVQHLWETKRASSGGPRAGGLADTTQLGLGHMGYAVPNRALELLGNGTPGFA